MEPSNESQPTPPAGDRSAGRDSTPVPPPLAPPRVPPSPPASRQPPPASPVTPPPASPITPPPASPSGPPPTPAATRPVKQPVAQPSNPPSPERTPSPSKAKKSTSQATPASASQPHGQKAQPRPQAATTSKPAASEAKHRQPATKTRQQPTAKPEPRITAKEAQQASSKRPVVGTKAAKPTAAPATAGEQLAEKEEARRKAPSWLVSLIFHLAMLLILALIPLNDIVQGPLTLVFGDSGSEGITEFDLKGAEESTETLEAEEATLDSAVNAFESLQSIELPDFSPNISDAIASTVAPESIPFGIRQGLSGRQGPMKNALLSKFGGNQETEDAVELGLKWLAKQQKSNGSWSLTGPYTNGSSVENTTAATAMAINAFLGAGYTHKQGKYRQNVDLGIKYLVRRQNSEGFFSKREPSRQQMYAQAIASIAIIEAFGMTNDPELRGPAMLAVSFAEWSQSPLKGWRYNPREDADVSVTGWFVMAMETAKMAGLPVDEKKLNSVNDFLDSVAYEEQARYAYNRFEPPSLSMTAEALLCRIYLGWPRTHPSLLAAIHDDLLPARPGLGDEEYSVYYWYYATQVLHHVGGGVWDQWNKAMKKTIPAMQEKTGPEAGSWDPGKDVFGASGGRLYTTCLSIYCLEVYYRHLALYDLK